MANKKFSVFGDSISTLEGYTPKDWRIFYEGAEADETGVHAYEDTWWGQVIDHFDGEPLANAAYSGSLVEGDGFPAGTAPERIAALAGVKALADQEPEPKDPETPKDPDDAASVETDEVSGGQTSSSTPGCLGPQAESPESPDVILVFIGINDYGWGSAAAAALGASAAAAQASARLLGNEVYGRVWQPSELPSVEESQAAREAFEHAAAASPEERLARFAQAYDIMLAAMRKSYPEAEIWCCTLLPGRKRGAQSSTHTYRLRGIPFADYNAAIRQAAENNGVHVADIFAAGQDYEAYDGTHPTALGMRQISSLVIAAMEGKPFPADSAWASTDPCVCAAAGTAPSAADAASLTADDAFSPGEIEATPASQDAKDPLYASSFPHSCETCHHADIDLQRWSCVCNASIKPL